MIEVSETQRELVLQSWKNVVINKDCTNDITFYNAIFDLFFEAFYELSPESKRYSLFDDDNITVKV
eukprot:Pgem_evm1s14888